MSSSLVQTDTIAALATPPGRGGIGIIRVSGSQCRDVAQALLGKLPLPRSAVFQDFKSPQGELLDQGIALYFPGPHSFTGEDVLELQGHGGTILMDRLLREVLKLGARLANPGEFSERAFLNGKIDLVQAEAIADLIDSSTEQASRCALRSLQGQFSERIHQLVADLTWLRTYIEAGIDFPDEEIDLLADGQVAGKINTLQTQLDTLLSQAQQGYLLREGLHIVIIGKPNVGKSSLLNALARRETAIVTDIAGTTRDIVRDSIELDGVPLHITDTAGLRETADPVEQEGIRRAREALQTADAVLLLVDDREQEPVLPPAEMPAAVPYLTLRNKADLSQQVTGFIDAHQLRLSVKQEHGLDLLKDWLKQQAGIQTGFEGSLFMARRRHLDALQAARLSLAESALQAQYQQAELIAEELRQAQQVLGSITGEVTADDLLGQIFSSFCIGK
ncbi:tRNA uridine-5-carboxymethylaminomethyl(34) synthesis GTPase MnmE [Candidatus Venteria ishoeyi]|uniref:tRNA modification GTPase MnmE n=1 Tax=Candidatus Venteria ishoeyi TaxID=1899563 RepID=A0A1H6FCS3_9GAMM|nr:tRNA uridine-5-carboxymethylaminomethyl(34) synthesis GTPase MnmE [Candidatus Venteria ishoeyi]MDM8546320.1 tRNA uridine-5-carboxymethylaminomethyl(34) synthesis GTPase MnmE [Candidatus Venteria ishoeyi]SEH06956.1 tRNA modification GTPase MnmE [Candidatus Venteria ishoeyi]